ncbi:MAG: hypothetical protein AB1894_03200 [Chloroflexota bacterium]
MSENQPESNLHGALKAWRAYLLLAAAQGLEVAWLVAASPSEPGRAVLGGLSLPRLVLLGLVVLAEALLLALLVETWRRRERAERRLGAILGWLRPERRWKMLLLAAVLALAGSLFLVTLTPEIEEPFTRAFFDRMLPLALWAAGLSGQTLIFGLFWGSGRWQRIPWPVGAPFLLALSAQVGVLLAWALVARPHIPQVSLRTGWNAMGAPLLAGQVLVAWLVGLCAWRWLARTGTPERRPAWLDVRKIDILLAALIWLAAVILWQSQPVLPNWFVTEPHYPSFEYFPSSDARAYDGVAQDVMVGAGFRFARTPFVRRPLHALYLLVLHALGGQDYEVVAFLQVLALALLPVACYFLAQRLHSRFAGVVTALLIIFREANALALADIITTSNVKLLMVDLVSALLVVIFAYLSVRWLSEGHQRPALALACGGTLGLSMLVRLETYAFILPLLGVAAVQFFGEKRPGLWVRQALVFALGIGLVILPWVWRNWHLTGMLFIDSPGHRQTLIQQRYGPFPTPSPKKPTPTPAANEAPGAQIAALRLDSAKTASLASALPLALPALGQQVDKDFFIYFLAHYLNSHMQTMLVFPTTWRAPDSLVAFAGHHSLERLWEDCCSPRSYVRRMPYWRKWAGDFPSQAIVPMLFNLLVLSIGVSAGWKRQRWAGILLLLYGVFYLGGNALFRNSGGRYLLPVDWASLVYFGIGLAQLSMGLYAWLSGRQVGEPVEASSSPAASAELRRGLYFAVALLIVGMILPVLENSFPDRYTQARQQEMLSAMLNSNLLSSVQRQDLQIFLAQGAVAYSGRILYPQFLPADDLESEAQYGPFDAAPSARLVFFLAGQHSGNYLLPLEQKFPAFPNASDGVVIMCPEAEKVETQVLAVGVFAADGAPRVMVLRAPFPPGRACPLPGP